MQYLLKVSLNNTEAWRLVAVDGNADRAFVAELISLAFNYKEGTRAFLINKEFFRAGSSGNIDHSDELISFDEFNLKQGDVFSFTANGQLEHEVVVMKAEDLLYCFVPSCMIGSGHLDPDEVLDYESINAYLNRDDCPSFNIREATSRMKAFGLRRRNVHEALIGAGASALDFKLN